jgi:uncharacterized protein (TIGR03435 family)
MHRWVLLAVLAPALLPGQKTPGRVEFEVASIKPSPPPSAERLDVGLHIDGAQVRCSYLSLKDYIRMAYQVKDYQVTGPDWIASDRFDIAAKLPEGAPREQVREMLQSLLADRFQVKLHHDQKEFPVYGLVVGKGGLKIKEAAPAPEAAGSVPLNITASGARGGTSVNLGNGASFTAGDNKFEGTKLTMVNTADLLSRFTDRPVVDMTDLKGRYDFTLEFTPEDFRAMRIRSALAAGITLPPQALKLLEESSGDSLFAAVEKLGLKLEPRKAPLDVLVIDHIEKTPTEN